MLIPISATNIVLATYHDIQLSTVLAAYPGITIKRIADSVPVQTGDPDPTIDHPEFLVDPQPAEWVSAQADWQDVPLWLKTWTAAQIDAYINTNVTDLASAKTVLRHIGKALVILRASILSR